MLTFYQYSKEKEKQELIAQIHFKHFLLGNLVSLNKKLFSVHDCDQLEKVVTRYFMEQFKPHSKLEIIENGNMEARPAFNKGPM